MKKNLKEKNSWKGVWTALITPLKCNENSGVEIDLESLKSLIDRQISEKVDGFVIAGSTGEGSLLNSKNYRVLIEAAVQYVDSRVPVVIGLGIGGTESCLENARLSQSLGADGVLASVPAYVRPSQEGIFSHYQTLDQLGIPVCLYDVPSRSASQIDIATVKRVFKECPNVHSLKDATGDLNRLKSYLDDSEEHVQRIALLSGEDALFSDFLKLGADGIVSVASHFALPEMTKIKEKSEEEKWDAAAQLQDRLHGLIECLFNVSNPIPTKSLAFQLKWIMNSHISQPLHLLSEEQLGKTVEEFELLKRERAS